jgi:ankyrin repeat protein
VLVLLVGSLALNNATASSCASPAQPSNRPDEIVTTEGSDVKDRTRERTFPPLVSAILADDTAAVREALASGADANLVFENTTPLGWALDGKHCEPDVLSALVKAGAHTESPIWPTGQPALHLALTGNKRPCVVRLIDLGADLFSRDASGATTLHAAASSGMLDLVDLFVQRGVDFQLVNSQGWSALMLGALNGHKLVVQRLLAAGADPCVRNKEGLSAADIARRRGLVDLAEMLYARCR